jgi:acetyl/propionyl-CoA carboxylase alpha subunit
MITGLDLVEWQLRVADGEPLPLTHEQLSIRGHSLEARIYAEEPGKGFLPSTGRLIHLASPPESLHVRVDTDVEQGDEITPYYDPMIAKLIVRDETRDRAIARMLEALTQYRIAGVANNVEFLAAVGRVPGVRACRCRYRNNPARARVSVARGTRGSGGRLPRGCARDLASRTRKSAPGGDARRRPAFAVASARWLQA